MNIKESDKISTALEEVPNDVKVLKKRYELVAWGAVLIWIGVIELIPSEPAGTGWLGIATILLGVNLMRYLSKIPMNIISITLGVIALILGASRLLHLRGSLPFFETFLIVIGVVFLVRSVIKLRQNVALGIGTAVVLIHSATIVETE